MSGADHPDAPADEGAEILPGEAEVVAGGRESEATDSDESDEAVSADVPLSVEDLLNELEAVTAERDQYLALAQTKQAEFENYRKRMMRQEADHVARAASRLVESLLPVLDALDAGISHGEDGLAATRSQLLGALEAQGLARLDPSDTPFDPGEHDAVAHDPPAEEALDNEDGPTGPVVAETLRAGYRWQGNLLRPVMVRVRG